MEIGREFHMNSIKRKFQSFHSVNIVEGTEREREIGERKHFLFTRIKK